MRTQRFITFMEDANFMVIDLERGLVSQFVSYTWRPTWTAVGHFLCSVSEDRYVYWQTAENISVVDMKTGEVMYMVPMSYIQNVGRVWEPSKQYFGHMLNKEERMAGCAKRATVYTYYSDMTLFEKIVMKVKFLWKEAKNYVQSLGV